MIMSRQYDPEDSGIYSQPSHSSTEFLNNSSVSSIAQNSHFSETEILTRSLVKLRKQFSSLRAMKKKLKLNENQLQVALSWGLEKVFNIRCPEMLEKQKDFLNHCGQFFNKLTQIESHAPLFAPQNISSAKASERQELEIKTQEKSLTERLNILKDVQKTQKEQYLQLGKQIEYIPSIIRDKEELSQTDFSFIKELNSDKEQLQNNRSQSNPKRQEAPVQKVEQEVVQKREEASGNKKEKKAQKLGQSLVEKLQKLPYFPIFQKKPNFLVEDKKVTKLANDDYRKICSLSPFKEGITYKIKFRVLNMGTIAIGLVSKINRGGLFIDDRDTDTLKFITFFNSGGGKIKLNGEEKMSGRILRMNALDELQLIYNSKTMIASFRTSKMPNAFQVEVDCFKGQEMYFYLEMKQKNTQIEFI